MLRKSTILTLLMLSLFVCGLQMAGPVAAVKVIDHRSYSYYDNHTNSTIKTTWKTYQYSKNYIIVKSKEYNNKKLINTETMTIKKVNSKKLKLVIEDVYKDKYPSGSISSYSKVIQYAKYSPNARNFYYHEVKPEFFNIKQYNL